MKYAISIWTTIIAFMVVTAAQAGSETGGGMLWFPKNSDGRVIDIKLGGEHPQQAKLLDLISKAELPTLIKRELISDLQSTSILLSNEKITFEDLSTQYMTRLQSFDETIITLPNGKQRKIEKKHWVIEELANQYGLCLYPVNIKVKDLQQAPLAAFTLSNRRQVIYFSDYVSQMDEHEQMKMVLHEQGHRLETLLGKRAHDERFVEGWAAGLLDYLVKSASKDEFYALLKRNDIQTYDAKGFSNERSLPENVYRATVNSVLTKDVLDRADSFGDSFWVQVKNGMFAGYPELLQVDYQSLYLGAGADPNADRFPNATKFFEEYKKSDHLHEETLKGLLMNHIRARIARVESQNEVLPLEIQVLYSKELKPNSTQSFYKQEYKISTLSHNTAGLQQGLEDQIFAILGENNIFYKIHIDYPLTSFAFWDPQTRPMIEAMSRNLAEALRQIKEKDVDHWNVLNKELRHLGIIMGLDAGVGTRTEQRDFLNPRYSSGVIPYWMTVALDAENHSVPTVEQFLRKFQIDAQFIKDEREDRKNKEAVQLNKELQTEALKKYGLEFNFPGHTAEDALVAYRLLGSFPKLIQKLQKVVPAVKRHVSGIQKVTVEWGAPTTPNERGEPTVRWNYRKGKDATVAVIEISLPSVFLNEPDLAALFDGGIASQGLSHENFVSGNNWIDLTTGSLVDLKRKTLKRCSSCEARAYLGREVVDQFYLWSQIRDALAEVDAKK
jgi:hypothetical protein